GGNRTASGLRNARRLAEIWRDLPGFTRSGGHHRRQMRTTATTPTMEIHMATVIALEHSAPMHLSQNELVEPTTLAWANPRFVEIAVGLEINSYACAELPEADIPGSWRQRRLLAA